MEFLDASGALLLQGIDDLPDRADAFRAEQVLLPRYQRYQFHQISSLNCDDTPLYRRLQGLSFHHLVYTYADAKFSCVADTAVQVTCLQILIQESLSLAFLESCSRRHTRFLQYFCAVPSRGA